MKTTVTSLGSVEFKNPAPTKSPWHDLWIVLQHLAYDQCVVIDDLDGRKPKSVQSSIHRFVKRRASMVDFELTCRIDVQGRVVVHKVVPDPEPPPAKKKTPS